jgi:hypothetical protein
MPGDKRLPCSEVSLNLTCYRRLLIRLEFRARLFRPYAQPAPCLRFCAIAAAHAELSAHPPRPPGRRGRIPGRRRARARPAVRPLPPGATKPTREATGNQCIDRQVARAAPGRAGPDRPARPSARPSRTAPTAPGRGPMQAAAATRTPDAAIARAWALCPGHRPGGASVGICRDETNPKNPAGRPLARGQPPERAPCQSRAGERRSGGPFVSSPRLDRTPSRAQSSLFALNG